MSELEHAVCMQSECAVCGVCGVQCAACVVCSVQYAMCMGVQWVCVQWGGCAVGWVCSAWVGPGVSPRCLDVAGM